MKLILTSIIAFISTNIDDVFLLTLFFSSKKYSTTEIFVGQITGIATLIVLALCGSLIGLLVDPAYIGLLGLFPIYLGLRELSGTDDGDANNARKLSTSSHKNVFAIAAVTIANGGDNIGVYIPLFTTLTAFEKGIMITIFFILTVALCVVAKYLTTHPTLEKVIEKYGKRVTPFVLILLGIYILWESNTLNLFF